MRVLILTQTLNNYLPLARITNENKMEYCDRHGYSFMCFYGLYNELAIGLQKSFLMQHMLPGYDLIHWQDIDSYIMNFNTKIEDLVDDSHGLWVGRDCNLTSGGSFIVANNAMGWKVLNEMEVLAPAYNWHYLFESQMIEDMSYRCPEIAVVENRRFNSYFEDLYERDNELERFQRGDFLLHLATLEVQHRIDIIKSERVQGQIIK
ncbi:MAG: hypothetical protein M0R80_08315 [Proteobacteria bacterium]|jgi:hypothetical protein|nr:hypothetical protein [Pseudomonadota bacterium]